MSETKKHPTPTDSSYSSLIYAFDYFNQALFDGSLPSVVITYHRQTRVMGYASFERWVDSDGKFIDELAINPEYFAKYPLIEICQTLVHEMVHIWQTHFGQPSRRNYHNSQWAKKMQSVGLMPSSTGLPNGKTTGEAMMDYVIVDGPFIASCRALKKQGFHIPLVDRFPVFRLERPILAYDRNGVETPLTNNYDVRHVPSALSASQKVDMTLYNIATDTRMVSTVSLGSETNQFTEPPITVIPSTSNPKQKAGRVKYSCRSCQTLLWAKRGLKVACLDCNIKFSQME
jgi:predicted SprT family Zn-dependent metalloprotease